LSNLEYGKGVCRNFSAFLDRSSDLTHHIN
jgi:hypothetical protein